MESVCQVEPRPRKIQREGTQPTLKPTPAKNVTAAPARFAFIDGLRGFAALAIVVFHIWWYEPEPKPALSTTHWIVNEAIFRARGGVQVFLVISGFVIAYSTRRMWVTPKGFAKFIGRRFVRLAPAYWVAIGVVVLVDVACQRLTGLPSPFEDEVSVTRILSHMSFLQDVVGYAPLGAGMWTICIEMQFYLIAVLGWAVAQRLSKRDISGDPRPSSAAVLAVFAPAAFVSLFHWRGMASTEPWVTHFLWMFFLGMATWWALDGTISRSIFAAIVSIATVQLFFDEEWRYQNSLSLATAIAIYAVGRRNSFQAYLNWPWLQYVGRISYSLYLIHFPVCHLITTAGWKLCGDEPTPTQAKGILFASFCASLLAGHVLHVLVEAPSARWITQPKTQTQ